MSCTKRASEAEQVTSLEGRRSDWGSCLNHSRIMVGSFRNRPSIDRTVSGDFCAKFGVFVFEETSQRSLVL